MPATILSIVAVVLAATSIGWQVVAFKRSGPVVRVTARQATFTYGDDWHVDVTAWNSGRSPATVTGWGLRFPDDQSIDIDFDILSWSAALPHRLEQGANGSWFIPTDKVRAECARRGIRYQDLTAYVGLADGRIVSARERGIGLA
jgi:hypothetical protein